MPSPFPGMDPWLEDPAHWRNVHARLISEVQTKLNSRLRPRYVASVEERIYLLPEDDPQARQLRQPNVCVGRVPGAKLRRSGVALAEAGIDPCVEMVTLYDPEVRESLLEIRDTTTREVVTVIEILSPTSKTPHSEGRRSFLAKRGEVTGSPMHWVEIDLLRGGEGLATRRNMTRHVYAVHVSPADMRPRGRIWPVQLDERLPRIGIPLRSPDADVPLDLQEVLDTAYDRAALDLVTDYAADPVPPLPHDQAAWADGVLRAAGLRVTPTESR